MLNKYYNDFIFLDEEGINKIPINVQVRKIKKTSTNLKAIIRLDYGGLIVDDIAIVERGNRLMVEFPSRNTVINKQTKHISTVFPGIPELSKQLNKVILNAYKVSYYESKVLKEIA